MSKEQEQKIEIWDVDETDNLMEITGEEPIEEIEDKQLDTYSMLIVSKYFNTIDDYITIEKTCKNYRGIIEYFQYNPISIKKEEDVQIFKNIKNYQYYENTKEGDLELIDFIKVKGVTVWQEYFVDDNYPDYFSEIYERDEMDDKIDYKVKINLLENIDSVRFINNISKDVNRELYEKHREIGEHFRENYQKFLKYKESLKLRNISMNLYKKGDELILLIGSTNKYDIINISDGEFGEILGKIGIDRIVIKKGVRTIGNFMFHDVSFLKDLILPENLIEIGKACFQDCVKLTNLILPDKLIRIGSDAFNGNRRLENIVIPDNVTRIGKGCFSECYNLERVRFRSENLKKISKLCFKECQGLEEVTFSPDIEEFDFRCFANCFVLDNLELPENLKKMKMRCFEGCFSLQHILFNERLEEIGNACFIQCASLTEIIIPDSVTYIGDDCFMNCSHLSAITLGDNLGTLKSSTFKNCYELDKIKIPASVRCIGSSCFENCIRLSRVEFENPNLSNLDLLGDECFKHCHNLEMITIPSTVTRIYNNSFKGCLELAENRSIVIENNLRYGVNGEGMIYDKETGEEFYF